jgi:heme-degrading monooxygenase HmoA
MKEQVYRIDKFVVPSTSKSEFLQKVHETHMILRSLPGFVSDFIVEQVGGPSNFNIVTIAIWENQSAIEKARDVMHEHQSAAGFNPQEFWDRLDIKADLGNYKRLDV